MVADRLARTVVRPRTQPPEWPAVGGNRGHAEKLATVRGALADRVRGPRLRAGR